ncbi:MAG: GNAT family N-acetyltransferase [Caulobacter sp.]|nr:GNAT family N-acetyltransferase [Caulobacter sp.]
MIETPRLILRGWREADLEPWAALNADPEVMRHFPTTYSRVESDAMAAVNQTHIEQHGFGLWAVERRDDGAFLGFTGLMTLRESNPLAPGVEAGWRLARHAWGQGYATEAARAALDFGFTRLALATIVAFTAAPNLPSQAVMGRLAMIRRPDLDFDHPAVPEGHVLRPHRVWSAAAP